MRGVVNEEEGSQEPLLISEQECGDKKIENHRACVFNLTKAVFGAGMMALPKACALLGAATGFGLMTLVGVLTWLSLSGGLVHPAAALTMTGRYQSGVPEYSDVVRSYLGPRWAQLLNLFLVVNSFGYEVLYVDVMADVLVGSGGSSGVLTELLQALQAPAWALDWILDRHVFLAFFLCFVVAPVILRRNMSSLDGLNTAGLAALAALGLSMLWLAVAALFQGKAYVLPIMPDYEALGSRSSSWVLAALALVPILMTSLACHLNTMPMAVMMKPAFTARDLDSVSAATMGISTLFYVGFITAAYTAFGENVQDDILINLNPSGMSHLLGSIQANLVAYTVRIAYVISLLVSVGINGFPLRDAVTDMICHSNSAKMKFKERYFTLMTATILVLIYIVSALVPSIWKVIGFVGSIAVTGVSFLFPSVIMFVFKHSPKSQFGYKMCAAVLFSLGLAIFVNGILRPL